ncbi:MAG TPA: flippase [Terracidiphilus sp.]|jgi:PST family polysaccharide transporter
MHILTKVKHRKGIQESLSNIGWLSSDRFIRMFGALIVGTMVARYLGPREFGFLSYALAIYNLFNIVSNLGLDSLVVRDIALDATREPRILGTGFVLKAAASVITTIAATIAAWFLDPHDRMLVSIVALLSFCSISQALDVIDYFFQAHIRSRYTVVPRRTAFVLASIAKVVAVFLHCGLLAFAWIWALEIVLGEIGLVISYFSYRRLLPRWNWDLGQAKSLLKESWPLLVSSLMIMVYMRTDQVLLGKLSSMEAVGNYTPAIRFSEIWYAIPMIVTTSVMPRLLKSREANPDLYYARLQVFYQALILVSLVVTLGTLAFGPMAVRLLYGSKFAAAANILSIHIWTGIFVSVGCVGGQQYVHEKITSSALHRTLLGAIANVVLNLLWIPRWGGIGSAMATLVAQGISSYFADALERRTHHIFRMKTLAFLRFWLLPFRLLQGTAE